MRVEFGSIPAAQRVAAIRTLILDAKAAQNPAFGGAQRSVISEMLNRPADLRPFAHPHALA